MPYDYAVLDNGSGGAGSRKTQRQKYVKKYLKSKGVSYTEGPKESRSKRERKLRQEARAQFRAMGKSQKGTSVKSETKTGSSGKVVTETRRNQGRPKVDVAERKRQERMRPKVDREAQRQLKGRSQNKNYVRGKNR